MSHFWKIICVSSAILLSACDDPGAEVPAPTEPVAVFTGDIKRAVHCMDLAIADYQPGEVINIYGRVIVVSSMVEIDRKLEREHIKKVIDSKAQHSTGKV